MSVVIGQAATTDSVPRGIHPKVGDACGELLKGSKAVLEQFQGDGGSGEWGHRLDATA